MSPSIPPASSLTTITENDININTPSTSNSNDQNNTDLYNVMLTCLPASTSTTISENDIDINTPSTSISFNPQTIVCDVAVHNESECSICSKHESHKTRYTDARRSYKIDSEAEHPPNINVFTA